MSYPATVLLLNVGLHLVCVVFMSTVLAEGGGEECQSRHFLRIQEKCRDRNDALLQAEKEHDDARVCTSLYKLWRCVATHVPVCFHRVTEIYQMYFHSPHNCILTVEQLQTLQKLTLASAHNNGSDSDGGDVDIEVDVVPLASSTTSGSRVESSTSSSLSSSSSSLGVTTVEDGSGEGGEVWDNVTEEVSVAPPGGDHRNNSHHKHTGSDASLRCHCAFTTIASLWMVAWLVTSSFLQS